MPEEIIVKKVFKIIRDGKSSFGKPRHIWFDDVENDLKKKMLLESKEKLLETEMPGN